MGVLWELNLTNNLHKKGMESFNMPYQIKGVCKPVESARVVGYFLPTM